MNTAHQYDLFEARANRDAGILKAVSHANAVDPGWSEKAYNLLLNFLNENAGSFQAEEVRSYAALIDFPLPPHARAWGGVIMKASKAGVIKRIGYKQVSNPKAHMANAAVWMKV